MRDDESPLANPVHLVSHPASQHRHRSQKRPQPELKLAASRLYWLSGVGHLVHGGN
jgi:hypothetical protein